MNQNDETHEKWNNVMTQSYNKLDHAKHNKHDAELNNRLLTEEWMNDDEKMRKLEELHESMKKGGKKAVPKKKKTSVKKKSKMRKKTAKKYQVLLLCGYIISNIICYDEVVVLHLVCVL